MSRLSPGEAVAAAAGGCAGRAGEPSAFPFVAFPAGSASAASSALPRFVPLRCGVDSGDAPSPILVSAPAPAASLPCPSLPPSSCCCCCCLLLRVYCLAGVVDRPCAACERATGVLPAAARVSSRRDTMFDTAACAPLGLGGSAASCEEPSVSAASSAKMVRDVVAPASEASDSGQAPQTKKKDNKTATDSGVATQGL